MQTELRMNFYPSIPFHTGAESLLCVSQDLGTLRCMGTGCSPTAALWIFCARTPKAGSHLLFFPSFHCSSRMGIIPALLEGTSQEACKWGGSYIKESRPCHLSSTAFSNDGVRMICPEFKKLSRRNKRTA